LTLGYGMRGEAVCERSGMLLAVVASGFLVNQTKETIINIIPKPTTRSGVFETRFAGADIKPPK